MSWDDGKHAKVKKVQLTFDDVIYSIQVTYEGTLQSQLRGSVGPKSAEFTLASDEYVTALSAYAKTLATQEVITALTFTTNKKTYGPFGNKSGYQISAPEGTGKQIAGFLGTSGNVLNSIDVHYAPVPTSGSGGGSGTGGSGTGGSGTGGSGSSSGSGVQKVDPQGGTGGTAWDDGSDQDGVTKITVRWGGDGIQYVKFDYVKGGQPKLGAAHGVQSSRSSVKEVVINHPDEYLVSVEGWYDSSNIILGIQFKTNKKTSEYIGYEFADDGTKFTLQVQDKKIIGFHGFASNHLNSIGAYFVPTASTNPTIPTKKLKAEGGKTGAEWDDGPHDNVKKVYVGQSNDGIGAVKFVYANGSQVVFGDEHGKKTLLGFEEFELESDEYITSVEGTYDTIFGNEGAIVTMLIFKTSKNKTAGPFGLDAGQPFVLKEEGYKIVGFHGRAGPDSISAVGAYLAPLGTTPLTPAKPAQKLEGSGGDGGTLWDDGAFDGVRKVFVGQADDGIGAVKFVYDKEAQPVVGNEHGKRSLLGFEEFVLDYPSEYITAVEGTYDKIYGSDAPIITMLRFKTNKQTSPPFGIEAGTSFELKKEGYKVVGFHGNASDLLHKFGVHVLPITN